MNFMHAKKHKWELVNNSAIRSSLLEGADLVLDGKAHWMNSCTQSTESSADTHTLEGFSWWGHPFQEKKVFESA